MSRTSPSLSEQIFNHAIRFVSPFASEPGHTWAAIPTGPVTHEACAVASDRFREWLAHSFHREHSIFPSLHSLRHAVRLLEAHARFGEHPRAEVFTRIGCRGDPFFPKSLIIDLANPAREVVEITRKHWRVQSGDGWRFRAWPGARPLPRPKRHSDPPFQHLATLLNLTSRAAYCRILAWLFAALRPVGPYPVLILTGPPSSGKTTLAHVLRNLLDPAAAPLHTLPLTERELFFFCLQNRVLAFDHVPRLTRDVSIALTRIAAGTAFAYHGRHPLDQSFHFAIERPVIVTVPYVDSAAADWTRNRTIANLAIAIHLDTVASERKRPQPEILRDLAAVTPYLLADLCTAATAALADATETGAAPPSRSADIHHWIAAAAPALGLTIEDVNSALAADPLIRALAALLQDDDQWTGSATQLHAIFETNAIEDLPATPQALSERLNRTPLAIYGIHLSHRRTDKERILKFGMTRTNFGASEETESRVMN